ncbi:MAG: hypothetical protein JSW40_03105 [Candidatus Omnitrophota bacterium]|nr:MAG: hypothetical protein JSW40_03105 [Candidatus Omnitrophota bacterium]
MSIIYEALKKTENRQTKDTSLRPVRKSILIVGIIGISIGAVVLLYGFFFRGPSDVQKTPIGSLPRTSSSPSRQVKEAKRVALPKKNEGPEERIEYHLQGLIYDDKDPLAFINGKRVGVGKRVDGALLVSVSKDGVELQTPEGIIRRLSLE